MKKNSQFFVCFLIAISTFVLFFNACQKSQIKTSKTSSQNIENVDSAPAYPRFRYCSSSFAPYYLKGALYSNALDSIGQWHNNYQDYILNKIISTNQNLKDTLSLKILLNNIQRLFFQRMVFLI